MACDAKQLLNDACQNGFLAVAQNPEQARAINLSLLCNIQEGGDAPDFLITEGGDPFITEGGDRLIAE